MRRIGPVQGEAMCSEQSFDNHDSFCVPSLAMVQLTWDTTQNTAIHIKRAWITQEDLAGGQAQCRDVELLEAVDRAIAFDRTVDRARVYSPSLFPPEITS